jgi:hypothetical protein
MNFINGIILIFKDIFQMHLYGQRAASRAEMVIFNRWLNMAKI